MGFLIPTTARNWQSKIIDGKTQNTKIYFCEYEDYDGVGIFPYGVGIWLKEATNASVEAVISIGTNIDGDGSVLANTTLTGMLTTNHYKFIPFTTLCTMIPEDASVYIKVETAATADKYDLVAQLVGGDNRDPA